MNSILFIFNKNEQFSRFFLDFRFRIHVLIAQLSFFTVHKNLTQIYGSAYSTRARMRYCSFYLKNA